MLRSRSGLWCNKVRYGGERRIYVGGRLNNGGHEKSLIILCLREIVNHCSYGHNPVGIADVQRYCRIKLRNDVMERFLVSRYDEHR